MKKLIGIALISSCCAFAQTAPSTLDRKVEEYYDRKVEEQVIIERLKDYEADQMRQAEARFYSKHAPKSSSASSVTFFLNSFTLVIAAVVAVIAAGGVWGFIKTAFSPTPRNTLLDHPDLNRPHVSTPESIGKATLNGRVVNQERPFHPDLNRPNVTTPESIGKAALNGQGVNRERPLQGPRGMGAGSACRPS